MKLGNKIKQIWHNIKYICKTYKWFNYMFENPFKIWGNKEIRQIFALPSIEFKIYNIIHERDFTNSIFGLYTIALSWKTKYYELEYESDPFIQINLFGVCFQLKFSCPYNDDFVITASYWESMLQYYDKLCKGKLPNLYLIIKQNTWTDCFTQKPNNLLMALTNKGFQIYCRDFNKINLKLR